MRLPWPRTRQSRLRGRVEPARATDPSLTLFRDGNWRDADVIARMGEILQALTADDLARSIVVVLGLDFIPRLYSYGAASLTEGAF